MDNGWGHAFLMSGISCSVVVALLFLLIRLWAGKAKLQDGRQPLFNTDCDHIIGHVLPVTTETGLVMFQLVDPVLEGPKVFLSMESATNFVEGMQNVH